MCIDFVRDKYRRKLSWGVALVLFMFACRVMAQSEAVAAADHLVRFVCQAYHIESSRFLDRVLILEQISTQAHDITAALSDEIDGTTLIDADHELFSTDETVFRARIYDGVSLVSNLPELIGHETGQVPEAERLDRDAGLDRYRRARQTTLSIGTTDDDVVSALRGRQAGFDAEGQRMDYMGIGSRSGGRFGFRSTEPHRLMWNVHIFLKISRAVVESGFGGSSAPGDGAYLCMIPILDSVLTESFSRCMQGNQGPVDLGVVATDRDLVRKMQRLLAAQSFDPGPFDGIFGPRTLSALQAWREAQGYDPWEPLVRNQFCVLLHPDAG